MAAPAITALLSPNPASGNTTTDGTEQTLASATAAPGVYQLDIDLTNMADGDQIEIRAYKKSNSSATEHLADVFSFANVQAVPVVEIGPYSTVGDIKFTLKRISGTDRAYQWGVINFTE